jgi:hypothetical protein
VLEADEAGGPADDVGAEQAHLDAGQHRPVCEHGQQQHARQHHERRQPMGNVPNHEWGTFHYCDDERKSGT